MPPPTTNHQLATLLLQPPLMQAFVSFQRRSLIAVASVAVLILITGRAEAQGIGFQGGVTVDPEQAFVGTHFETGELFQNVRFRPGVDGGFGGGFSLATLNIEFLYHFEVGRSWSVYQGGGPAVVFIRQNDRTSTHAGSFFTFGFAHENGFFTDFKLGTGNAPTLKFGVGFTVRKKAP
jgi:hypothetical protein